MPAALPLWIDTSDNNKVCRGASGHAPAGPKVVLFNPLNWQVRFRDGDEGSELPEGSSLELVLKKPLDLEGEARLIITLTRQDDDTWSTEDAVCDSAELRDDITGFTELDYAAQFLINGERSLPFLVKVLNSPRQPDEVAPTPASDAWWTKIKATFEEGDNVTLNKNDGTKKVTISAEAGGVTSWNDLTDKPATFAPSAHNHDDRYFTEAEVNALLALKAMLESPAFTGTPTAPTAAVATNNTQLATCKFVHDLATELINGSPSALDTLKELADALGDDPNFAATVTEMVAGKLAKDQNLADLTDAEAARVNLGLGNVENTSDADKPVSTAVAAALEAKADADDLPDLSTYLQGTLSEDGSYVALNLGGVGVGVVYLSESP